MRASFGDVSHAKRAELTPILRRQELTRAGADRIVHHVVDGMRAHPALRRVVLRHTR